MCANLTSVLATLVNLQISAVINIYLDVWLRRKHQLYAWKIDTWWTNRTNYAWLLDRCIGRQNRSIVPISASFSRRTILSYKKLAVEDVHLLPVFSKNPSVFWDLLWGSCSQKFTVFPFVSLRSAWSASFIGVIWWNYLDFLPRRSLFAACAMSQTLGCPSRTGLVASGVVAVRLARLLFILGVRLNAWGV